MLPFADKVYSMRVEATYEKDNSKATTAKLFGNSGLYYHIVFVLNISLGYGKCAEDVSRHTKLHIVETHQQKDKHTRSPFCTGTHDIADEEGAVMGYEILKNKTIIKDDKPILYGVAILQWSKLLFLRY